jgi:putative redox protein
MAKVVVTSAPSGMQHKIEVGTHKLVSDAFPENGGIDAGPSPHEFLLGALGACTSMTLKLYAQKRNIDLKKVRVTLNEERIEDPKNPPKQISKITRDIEVEGNLSAQEIDSLKAIADKCPIHKLITESNQVVTNIETLAASS